MRWRASWRALSLALRPAQEGTAALSPAEHNPVPLSADELMSLATTGSYQPLILLLSGSDETEAENAALALSSCADGCALSRVEIARAGAIVPLVKLLRSERPGCGEAAAAVLSNLAADDGNQVAIAAAGAVYPLIDLVRFGSIGGRRQAAAALANLAANDENEAAIVAAGAVAPLVELLRSEDLGHQEAGADALANLSVNSRHKVCGTGADTTLILPLHPCALGDEVEGMRRVPTVAGAHRARWSSAAPRGARRAWP